IGRGASGIDGVLAYVKDLSVEGHFDKVFLSLDYYLFEARGFCLELDFAEIDNRPPGLKHYCTKCPGRIAYEVDYGVIGARGGFEGKGACFVGDAPRDECTVGRAVKANGGIGQRFA